MDPTLVVVPDSYHRDLGLSTEVNRNCMVISCGEGSKPHMQIVIGEVVIINKFVNSAWISPIAREDVNIWWACRDLSILNFQGKPIFVKDLDPSQTDVVHIAPCSKDVELKLRANWQIWDRKILVK